jgi:hypothetical protein
VGSSYWGVTRDPTSEAEGSGTGSTHWGGGARAPATEAHNEQRKRGGECDRTTSEMRGPSSRIWIG